MKSAPALTLFAVVALGQQTVSNPGFRIAYVQKLYIENLGTDDAAKLVRDLVTGAILRRTNLQVQSEKLGADAVLIGTAIVSSGSVHWAVGSATASPASATAQVATGGKTVHITQLGLQLLDTDGRIMWAFDGSHCLDVTTLLLWGVPRKKAPTVCAVEQLVKAIDKDVKDSRRRR
jgi:hypothetical protein